MSYTPGDLSKLFGGGASVPDDVQPIPEPVAPTKGVKANLSEFSKHKRKKVKKGLISVEDIAAEIAADAQENKDKGDAETTEDGQKANLSRKKRAAGNLEKLQRAKERERKVFAGKGDKMHNEDERNNRTVFVGNVPVNSKEKELQKIFSKYGEIESLRFRSLSRANPKISKRAAFAKKEFHEERDTCNIYIVFKEAADALKSLVHNGQTIGGSIVRVDLAGNSKKNDNANSVFVGNLNFKAKEDDVRTFFMTCGTVTNVRIVRDNFSCLGKGFGFVSFESAASVRHAITFDGCKFEDRPLRVYKSVDNPKKFTKKGADGKASKKGAPKKVSTQKKGQKKKFW